MMPDPVVTHLLAAALAIVLLVGAGQKLRDVAAFRAALEAYELLPVAVAGGVAWALPGVEALAGLTLVIEPLRGVGVALSAGLLVVVTSAVVINLLRGRNGLGCGCGGIEDEQTLSWTLVARNVMLLALLAVVSFSPAVRVLQWLDYISVAAGACALYGLYAMINQLLANQPRLMRLRSLA